VLIVDHLTFWFSKVQESVTQVSLLKSNKFSKLQIVLSLWDSQGFLIGNNCVLHSNKFSYFMSLITWAFFIALIFKVLQLSVLMVG